MTDILRPPRRIRAYPDQTLRVVYAPSDLDTLQDSEQLAFTSWDNDLDLDISDSDGHEGANAYDMFDEEDEEDEYDGSMAGAVTIYASFDFNGALPPAESTSLTATNIVEPVSDSGPSSTTPSNSNITSLNQAVQTFRFTLPSPPNQISFDAPADGARLEAPQLDIATQEFTVPETIFPQNFFILPQEWTTGAQIYPQAQFNFFRMCVCGPNKSDKHFWVPHLLEEQRPSVRKSYEFIDMFAPALLANTRLFHHSLRIPLNAMNSSPIPLPEVPFTHPCKTAEHIQMVLNLVNVDVVELLLEEMVKYLENLLSQRAKTIGFQQPSKPRHPLFERYQLSAEDIELLPKYVDLPNSNPPSAYLSSDDDGNSLCVCLYHYCCLDPGFELNHVRNTIGHLGQYDASTGKINVHLPSPEDLTAICRINPAKAGYITHLNATLGWRLSPEELTSLVRCAANLYLRAVSMTVTSSGAGPSSAASRSKSSGDAETVYAKNLLRQQLVDMNHITFNCNSNFDTTTVLENVPLPKLGAIFLTLKSCRQEVSSILYSDRVIDHVKSDLKSLPLMEGGSLLAGKMQNLTIVSDFFPSDEGQASVWRTALLNVVQENLALASLTINCSARDFRTAYNILRPILQDKNSPSITRKHRCFLVLKDNILNDITALFNFVPLDCERSVTIDVTAGTNGRALFPIINRFGAVIRVFNLLDNTAKTALLLKNFARAKPGQLVSLMLTLDSYVAQSGPDLSTIIALSKATFKQLTLIGHPRNLEAASSLIKVVESLRGCDVILMSRAGTNTMEAWNAQVRGAIHKRSRVFDDDSAENVRLMVPELSDSAFASMKASAECSSRHLVKRRKVAHDVSDATVDFTSFSL